MAYSKKLAKIISFYENAGRNTPDFDMELREEFFDYDDAGIPTMENKYEKFLEKKFKHESKKKRLRTAEDLDGDRFMHESVCEPVNQSIIAEQREAFNNTVNGTIITVIDANSEEVPISDLLHNITNMQISDSSDHEILNESDLDISRVHSTSMLDVSSGLAANAMYCHQATVTMNALDKVFKRIKDKSHAIRVEDSIYKYLYSDDEEDSPISEPTKESLNNSHSLQSQSHVPQNGRKSPRKTRRSISASPLPVRCARSSSAKSLPAGVSPGCSSDSENGQFLEDYLKSTMPAHQRSKRNGSISSSYSLRSARTPLKDKCCSFPRSMGDTDDSEANCSPDRPKTPREILSERIMEQLKIVQNSPSQTKYRQMKKLIEKGYKVV